MLYLPNQYNNIKFTLDKIDTYLGLFKLGCPVLKSAILFPNEIITDKLINSLSHYFGTEEVNIRYQYVSSCANPIKGGNRYALTKDNLIQNQIEGTILWILEPTNRFCNEFGINIYFELSECIVEIVGKGFDVSDLNRGHISPHETICIDLPIRKGEYNDWWKFMLFSFQSDDEYQYSKQIRTEKLKAMNLSIPDTMFSEKYQPLPFEKLEELLEYISVIHTNIKCDCFCVSCSIINNKFVFWDLQTYGGKKYLWFS